MPRAAWYRGTEIEALLMGYSEWLSRQPISMGTMGSYRAHVSILLRDGVQTERDIWTAPTGDAASKNTRTTAWRSYQRYLDEIEGRTNYKVNTAQENAVKAFMDWLPVRLPRISGRTVSLYGGILRRIIGAVGTGTIEECRAAVEGLPRGDRVKARVVWKYFSSWYGQQPGVTGPPPDPWKWEWTYYGAEALRFMCGLSMSHTDRLQMRWKDFQQEITGEWMLYWPFSKDPIGRVSNSMYSAWKEQSLPKNGESYLIPEFPGSAFPASIDHLNDLLEDSADLVREYRHIERNQKLNQEVLAARDQLLDGTWGKGKREKAPAEIEGIVDPTGMIHSGLAAAARDEQALVDMQKAPKVASVLTLPDLVDSFDNGDDFY